jgi:hypothetical protein
MLLPVSRPTRSHEPSTLPLSKTRKRLLLEANASTSPANANHALHGPLAESSDPASYPNQRKVTFSV